MKSSTGAAHGPGGRAGGWTRPRRTVLFVGALSGGLAEAARFAPDMVCIDIEDAVPPGRKSEGRQALPRLLADEGAGAGCEIAVRINSLRTLDGLSDIRACLTELRGFDALVLPKVETADEIRWAGGLADEAGARIALLPIIETADGLSRCGEIARAHPRLGALMFGGFDLSAALGCEMSWEPLLYGRSRVVHAAAAAGIEAIDSPFPALDDLPGLREACRRARDLGMAGKTAKDGRQVATIREAFAPEPAQIDRARSILARFDQDPTAPLVVDGRLVELPTVKRLRRLIEAC